MTARFEVGKTYGCPSACDHNCIFKITIVSRTEKTAVITGFRDKRCKIHVDELGYEFIEPERYSMAPLFRPEDELGVQ